MPASKKSSKKRSPSKRSPARRQVSHVTRYEGGVTGEPLIFISHDSRDHELAEAFSTLLHNVSMGVLKSFRSSDTKGTQGIEFGSEWFPTVKEKLLAASDVVCLLTKNSLDRPWILYEAGIAFGKLDTSVLGVAIGIPLTRANTGPFAQFQNCGDDVDALTKLVIQLARRVPNSEPSRDLILPHVGDFKRRVEELISRTSETGKEDLTEEEPTVPALFEEVKAMFQDLSRNMANMDKRMRAQPTRFTGRFQGFRAGRFLENLSGTDPVTAAYAYLGLIRDVYPGIYALALECLHEGLHEKRPKVLSRRMDQLDLLIKVTLEVDPSYPYSDKRDRHQELIRNFMNLIAAVVYDTGNK
jgi:hypothetical protein